jgi:hypothetical protein
MIVCSNCLHHNLDEAAYCEACGAKLPEMVSCSNCGAPVQTKAHFCGQCGFNLQISAYQRLEPLDAKGTNSDMLLPEPFPPEPIIDFTQTTANRAGNSKSYVTQTQVAEGLESPEPIAVAENVPKEESNTHIQPQSARLLHVQSNTLIELSEHHSTIHIGKPNDRVPPDINVSVFPNAEVVSRVHAAIHIEGELFFVEDVGSANGTYLNNMPLTPSTRYRLRVGDRVSLGKGELMTFVFKVN